MRKSKQINVLSLAQLNGLVLGFIGLICGILYSVGGFFIDLFVTIGWMTSTETPGLSYGTVLAFLALIGMPLLAGVFGFIAGAIIGFLYNFISKFTKIRIDL